MSRLDRITTGGGDDGQTGPGDGSRLPKHHPRIEAMGAVDELNSTLGLLLAGPLPDPVRSVLAPVQHDLFDLGAELAVPDHARLDPAALAEVDAAIESLNAGLPPLEEFVLPGGTPATAACHLARTVCRRAERALCALGEAEAPRPESLRYLNRLSDLLFIAARVIQRTAGVPEVAWDRGRRS